jgi:4-amino-4-deoxy-L-arabinose transferase-like glycosyltransferase
MPESSTSQRRTSWLVWGLLAIVLVSVCVIRWRLRECPLERDEGEYAYIGRLLLNGEAPYGAAGNHKFPGGYIAYAAIMALFGENASGIHLGFLVVNLASTALLFFLGRRLSGDGAGLAAAAAWAVMSVSPNVFGNAGHITQLVMLAVLAGLVFLWRGIESGNRWQIAAAGVCLGMSVVVRQTSLIFVAFGLVFLWMATRTREAATQKTAREVVSFIAGSAFPLLAMALWLLFAGVFSQFWRWTVLGAAAYGSQTSLSDGVQKFLEATPAVIGWNWLIWLLAGVGLVLAVSTRTKRDWFLIGFLVTGFIALLPGLYFREHYYVQVLPAIASFFGTAIQTMWDFSRRGRYPALIGAVIALCLPLVLQRKYFLERDPTALARQVYGGNPFPEAIEIGRYLRDNSDPTDPVAVLGSEPEIFFYSNRRSATILIYSYPLLERHANARAMQETMAHEIEDKRPKFVVMVNVPTSWLTRSDSDLFIFSWAEDFLPRFYELDGVADILAEGSQYVWGPAAANYRPRSPYFISLYRRAN